MVTCDYLGFAGVGALTDSVGVGAYYACCAVLAASVKFYEGQLGLRANVRSVID